MKILSAEFVKSGTRPEHFPESALPEVAFAGRSNVGKSSLMNSMMDRRKLVKVSNTPGRTQLLSWFRVNEQIMFCDLPGYGFAKVPSGMRASWAPMVNNYLTRRSTLRAVAVLADVRRGFEEDDLQLIESAASIGKHCILVATKCDKITRNELTTRKRRIAEALHIDAETDIIWYSSETGAGRIALWKRILSLAGVSNGAPEVASDVIPYEDDEIVPAENLIED